MAAATQRVSGEVVLPTGKVAAPLLARGWKNRYNPSRVGLVKVVSQGLRIPMSEQKVGWASKKNAVEGLRSLNMLFQIIFRVLSTSSSEKRIFRNFQEGEKSHKKFLNFFQNY